jgi:hypothetical protein
VADVQVSRRHNTVSSGSGSALVVHRYVGFAVPISEMSSAINITGKP